MLFNEHYQILSSAKSMDNIYDRIGRITTYERGSSMTFKKANFSLLLILFTIGNFVQIFTALQSSNSSYFMWHWSLLTVSVVLILLLSPKWSFISITMLALLYGLYLCLLGYAQTTDVNQLSLILLYISYLLFVIPLILIRHIFFHTKNELSNLKKEIESLKKYIDPNGKMLTKQEFVERSTIVLRGMKRREEQGYLLKVSLKVNGITDQAWNELIQRVIEDTIRSDYDFFMGFENSVIVFLQNTHKQGVLKFQQRLIENLRKNINFIQPPLQFQHKLIEQFDEDLQVFIQEET